MLNRITIFLAALSMFLGLGLVAVPKSSNVPVPDVLVAAEADAHMAGCWVNARRPTKLTGLPAAIAKAGWSCDYAGGSHDRYFGSTIRLQYWSSYNGGSWFTLAKKTITSEHNQDSNYVAANLANGCKQYRTVQDFYQITAHGSLRKVSTARTVYALCR